MHESSSGLSQAGFQALARCVVETPGQGVTVCDSDFACGNRFLSFRQAWKASAPVGACLHYVGWAPQRVGNRVPMPAWAGGENLATPESALADWLPGVNRLFFDDGQVSLTVFHMPLKQALIQTVAQVDLFMLDRNFAGLVSSEPGFAPMGQVARLAAPGAVVLADTANAHDQVWRGLRRAGFLEAPVDPVAGHPSLRRCGSDGAVIGSTLSRATLRPGVAHGVRRDTKSREVAVVGGGIAGAGVAFALARRGYTVHVFDRALGESRQGRHQGHLGAAVTPALSRDDDHRARLSRAGARMAWLRWRNLSGPARPVQTGTAAIADDPDERRRLIQSLACKAFPQHWASWHEADDAFALTGQDLGRPFVYFPEGLVLQPGALVQALLSFPGIHVHSSDAARIRRQAGQWQVASVHEEVMTQVSNVVLANAAGVPALLQVSGLPVPPRLAQLQAVAGQVSYFDAGRFSTPAACVLDGDGYWLPAINGLHVGGGTYDLGATQACVSADGHRQVIDKVAAVLGVDTAANCGHDSGSAGLESAVVGGWAGWRAVVPGRLPVIGELQGQQGLWLACAYGSRGLTWSALAGEIIAAGLGNEPLPLERELLKAIAPR